LDLSEAPKALRRMSMTTAALLVQFLVSIAFNLMGGFMPLFISSDLGFSLIDATYWTGIAALVSSSLLALTAPFWGWMCDRVGVKKIMLLVIVGNIIVYAGMALSADIIHIVLFRGLQGTFGGLSTVMFALVASVVPAKDLKKALSYQMVAMTMGSLVAPGIGGVMASLAGYRITLASSAILFVCMIPVVSILSMPPPEAKRSDARRFTFEDFKSILPEVVALVLVYACISFIAPTISWFLESLGIPYEQLLLYTTAATVLNGLAYAVATPLMTKVITDRSLPFLSVGAGVAIMATAFVVNPIQFIALRVLIGAIQAGIPPNLLGGKSSRRGTGMGFLNSARFLGMAIGPFLATSILGNGEPPQPFNMFATMCGMSLVAAIFIYCTHTRKKTKNDEEE
jgi:DHA1 family multidrug resistance protein-like MFS transporter